ncbi:hypothetical protein PARU111607_01165 [Palleronia rufa]
MKRTRVTDEQIIGILAEHEAGAKCADLCRKHGMSEGTFYNWKAKFGGMTVSEAKRLKALEDENAKLKKLLAEQMLDLAAMKDLIAKKRVGPAVKREAVTHLRAKHGLSERRACHIVGADRTMIRYRSQRAPNTVLRGRLRELATERRRFGYRRLFVLLRREGEPSGIYRLYREEGLTVRKRKARRKALGTRAPILVEARPNARWSLDFVHDQFANGQRFRVLNVVDDVTRECLAAIPFAIGFGPVAARWLTLDLGAPCRARTNGPDRAPRKARYDCQRQRHGTDFECHPAVVFRTPDRVALHRAGQAHAERLRGELQRANARRAAQRDHVPEPGSRTRRDRRLGSRLQHRAPTLGLRLPNPGRLRADPDHRNRPPRCAR